MLVPHCHYAITGSSLRRRDTYDLIKLNVLPSHEAALDEREFGPPALQDAADF